MRTLSETRRRKIAGSCFVAAHLFLFRRLFVSCEVSASAHVFEQPTKLGDRQESLLQDLNRFGEMRRKKRQEANDLSF